MTPRDGIGRQRGVTLLELIITLTVAAVLIAGAVPAFQGLAQRQKLAGAQHEFLAALAHGRQAAVTHGVEFTLCPSANGADCLARGRWHRGWIGFADRDGDRERDEGEPVRLRDAGLDDVTLTSSKWRRRITFLPTGIAGGGSNATFTLCASGGARAVILSRLGRARVSKKGPGGRELACPRRR